MHYCVINIRNIAIQNSVMDDKILTLLIMGIEQVP